MHVNIPKNSNEKAEKRLKNIVKVDKPSGKLYRSAQRAPRKNKSTEKTGLRSQKKLKPDKPNGNPYRSDQFHVDFTEDVPVNSDIGDLDSSTDDDLYCPSLPDVDAPSENESLNEPIILNSKGKLRRTKQSKIKRKQIGTSRVKITKRRVNSAAKKKKNQKYWIDGDFEKTTRFPSRGFGRYADLSVTELFELFFTDDIFSYIQMESTKYASSLNCPDPKITITDLKCFFGILVLSGYNKLPGKTFYWDGGIDVGNQFVKNAMRRDRFVTIMRFMHWSDNSKMDETDKLWKIRPVADMLQELFLKHFVPTEHINYDESMVRYYGRHSIKQCIKMKPVPFGYKIWCVNTSTGYLVAFEIYQGKSHKSNEFYIQQFGKCTAPLIHMLDRLPEKDLPFQIYTDNLFTSFNLLTELRKRGYGVTGTIRKNRLPKDIPLPTQSEMEKKGRGAFASTISKDDGIITVRWTDNAVVSMASTTYGVQPMTLAKRYSKADRKHVEVDRPFMIAMYNKYMGGTDRMDQDIGRNRINIRGKKWYWPLLTWLIDAAINNAWTLYKNSGRKMTNFKFRRILARTYMQRYGQPPKKPGRPFSKQMPDEQRFDGINHLVEFTTNKNRRKCAMEKCKSSVRTQCKKCNCGICIGCFVPFHTKA